MSWSGGDRSFRGADGHRGYSPRDRSHERESDDKRSYGREPYNSQQRYRSEDRGYTSTDASYRSEDRGYTSTDASYGYRHRDTGKEKERERSRDRGSRDWPPRYDRDVGYAASRDQTPSHNRDSMGSAGARQQYNAAMSSNNGTYTPKRAFSNRDDAYNRSSDTHPSLRAHSVADQLIPTLTSPYTADRSENVIKCEDLPREVSQASDSREICSKSVPPEMKFAAKKKKILTVADWNEDIDEVLKVLKTETEHVSMSDCCIKDISDIKAHQQLRLDILSCLVTRTLFLNNIYACKEASLPLLKPNDNRPPENTATVSECQIAHVQPAAPPPTPLAPPERPAAPPAVIAVASVDLKAETIVAVNAVPISTAPTVIPPKRQVTILPSRDMTGVCPPAVSPLSRQQINRPVSASGFRPPPPPGPPPPSGPAQHRNSSYRVSKWDNSNDRNHNWDATSRGGHAQEQQTKFSGVAISQNYAHSSASTRNQYHGNDRNSYDKASLVPGIIPGKTKAHRPEDDLEDGEER